ncbi:MAG TPA: hypothetical protein VGK58_04785, partial [Lacipirellulaceae bacterium]
MVLINGQTMLIKAGGTYTNNNVFTIASALSIANGGTLEQAAGTLTYNTTSAIAGGTFRYLGGTINGTPILTNATLAIGPGVTQPASFILQNTSALELADNHIAAGQMLTVRNSSSSQGPGLTAAAGFTNDGSILLTGTSSGTTAFTITSGALVNGPMGLLHFQTGGTGNRIFRGNLTNHGTVIVSRTTTFDKAGGMYANEGQFTIAASQTLTLAGGVFDQIAGLFELNGALNLSGGSTLNLNGGEFALNGTLNGASANDVVNLAAGGVLNMNGEVTSNTTIVQSGGTLNYTSGTIGGRFEYLGGTINGAPVLSGATLVVGPEATDPLNFVLRGFNQLSIRTGFTNKGAIQLTSTGSGTTQLSVANGTLVNGPTGLLHFLPRDAGEYLFVGDLSNSGSVRVDRHTTFIKTGGMYANSDHFTINAGQTLSVINDGTFEQVSGTLDILGTLRLSGGTFKYLGGTMNGAPLLVDSTLEIGPEATNPATFALDFNNSLVLPSNSLPAGYVLNIQGTSGIINGLVSATGFTNNASIVLTSATSATTSLRINDGALVNSPSGLLHFQPGGTGLRRFTGSLINHGQVLIDRSTELDDFDGVYTNHSQVLITAGQALTTNFGTFEQVAGTLEILGSMTMGSGRFRYLGGTISGVPLLNGAGLEIGPGATNPATFILEGSTGALTFPDSELLPVHTIVIRSTAPFMQGRTAPNGF